MEFACPRNREIVLYLQLNISKSYRSLEAIFLDSLCLKALLPIVIAIVYEIAKEILQQHLEGNTTKGVQ
jgi:hypothetical protein